MINSLVAKAKGEMIKSLAKRHARARRGNIGKGDGVSPLKPPRPRGIRVFPLKKTQNSLVLGMSTGLRVLVDIHEYPLEC